MREQRVDFRDALIQPVFEQRKKNILLALEICIEGAARVTGERCDIFQARGFESVARKRFFGGGQELAASGFRACALPGNRRNPFSPER